jgi:hypothetical protein
MEASNDPSVNLKLFESLKISSLVIELKKSNKTEFEGPVKVVEIHRTRQHSIAGPEFGRETSKTHPRQVCLIASGR